MPATLKPALLSACTQLPSYVFQLPTPCINSRSSKMSKEEKHAASEELLAAAE
jgi:hypothetical protein